MSRAGKTLDVADWSRRNFLKVGTAAGGGLMLGFHVGDAFAQEKKAAAEAAAPTPTKYVLNPNAFIAITPEGKVSFQIPQEEMGQGVYTSLSQLLADELDVDFADVTPLPAPPIDAVYGSPRSHRMGTGGSQSIRSFYTPLRQVGASGRAMFV
jgi:isoquinoline 1-oxidoreductase subunit beta